MLLGKLAKKPSPGTQENQNVPIGVVPVSCRVMLYCQSDGQERIDRNRCKRH